jgi:hypothetical protein
MNVFFCFQLVLFGAVFFIVPIAVNIAVPQGVTSTDGKSMAHAGENITLNVIDVDIPSNINKISDGPGKDIVVPDSYLRLLSRKLAAAEWSVAASPTPGSDRLITTVLDKKTSSKLSSFDKNHTISSPRIMVPADQTAIIKPAPQLSYYINNVALPLKEKNAEVEQDQTEKNITLNVQNEDILNIIRMISEASGKTIVIPAEGINGKVTAYIKGMPWDQALDHILCVHDLGFVEEDNVLKVYKLPSPPCDRYPRQLMATD